jgi:hypothetical protein
MSPDKIIELARKIGICELTSKPKQDIHYSLTIHEMQDFANLVAQLERERIATSIERLPFGDTAASFAIYVRELKDD